MGHRAPGIRTIEGNPPGPEFSVDLDALRDTDISEKTAEILDVDGPQQTSKSRKVVDILVH